MLRLSTVAIGLLLGLNLLAANASAQWGYPRGYGGYGMSRWGQDPGAGYMAGLGSFARGQGAYQLDKARADAINVETMVKWNKALRARQAALREDKRKQDAKEYAALAARVDRLELKDGTTLNSLLAQILDIDPAGLKSGRANAPISPAAIREIPFEWNSEAVTFCLDEMTGQAALPTALASPIYAENRKELHDAIQTALAEDRKGTVSRATVKQINHVIAQYRDKYLKNSMETDLGHQDALAYFTTSASLSRLLNDPSMNDFLARLNDNQETNVGNLLAFMNSHNLRFGPAKSDRQVVLYERLVPDLTAIRDQVKTEEYAPTPPDRNGENMKAAAKNAFKPMPWEQLQAHARHQ